MTVHRRLLVAGVGGATVAGVGLWLSTPADSPAPEVSLVSFDSVLVPQAPPTEWWLEGDGLFGPATATPTPNALAAAAG